MRIPEVIQSYVPEISLPRADQVVRNLNKIELPAIALSSTYMFQYAEARCQLDECWRQCAAHEEAFPSLIWACQALCLCE